MPFSWFEWAENTSVGETIRNSLWMFPVIEAIHLLALCVLGGSLLIVDLRLLGLGLKNHPVAEIARSARPYLIAGLLVMLATGMLLFLSESVKLFYSTSFWVKMVALPLAILLTFTIRDRLVADERFDTSSRSRVLGVVSMILWFTVAAAGRWIGFSA